MEHYQVGYGAFDVIDDADQAYIIDFDSTPYWGEGCLGPLRSLVSQAPI